MKITENFKHKTKKWKLKNRKTDLLVYTIGILLIIGFGALLVIRPQVIAGQTSKKQDPNTQVKLVKGQEFQSPEAVAVSPVPATENQTQVLKKSESPSPVSQSQIPPTSQTAPAVNPIPVIIQDSITVKIAGVGTFNVNIKNGESAFDALKDAASQNNFALDYSVDPTYGSFIKGIGGVENNNSTSEYWTLYYNGSMAQVGASSQNVSNNDVIEWRYEALSW